jgi:hypothetical protein
MGDSGVQRPHEIVVPVLIPRSVLDKHMVIRLDVRIVQEVSTPEADTADPRREVRPDDDLAASA